MSACYDYFKWNEYLTGGGTDHPEGGFIDRNYYGAHSQQVWRCSINFRSPIMASGGSPKPVFGALKRCWSDIW